MIEYYRALGFEPKKEEIKKMISDIDKVCLSMYLMKGTSDVDCVGWIRDD